MQIQSVRDISSPSLTNSAIPEDAKIYVVNGDEDERSPEIDTVAGKRLKITLAIGKNRFTLVELACLPKK